MRRTQRSLFAPVVVVIGITLLGTSGCERPEPGPAAKPIHQSRAKSQFDDEVLTGAFDRLVAWHDSVGTGWSAGAGTDRETSILRFDDAPFRLNDELQILWERVGRSGTPFLLDYRLLGADEARSRYDELRADPELSWRPNWIPLLESEERWLVVESSRSTAPAGPVVFFEPGTDPIVVFTNVTRMLQTLAEVAASPSTRWVDGAMRVDPALLRQAHGEHNRDAEWSEHVTGS